MTSTGTGAGRNGLYCIARIKCPNSRTNRNNNVAPAGGYNGEGALSLASINVSGP